MSGAASRQLGLTLYRDDRRGFDDFVAGGNEEAVALLRRVAESGAVHCVWLHGPAGTGKTHLLHAACGAADLVGRRAGFIPLADFLEQGPAILAGLETLDLVCLDGIEAVAGAPDWERALFNLYNDISAAGGNLLVAAPRTPAALGLALPDLASRFASGLILRLAEVDDRGRAALLRTLAARRGMELPSGVAEFMLRRLPRTAAALADAVARLDAASLSAQRKLTVPFVRTVLNLDGVEDAVEGGDGNQSDQR